MNRISFVDGRGDESRFILYSTNEIRLTKRVVGKDAFSQIDLSAEAVAQLNKLISGSETCN